MTDERKKELEQWANERVYRTINQNFNEEERKKTDFSCMAFGEISIFNYTYTPTEPSCDDCDNDENMQYDDDTLPALREPANAAEKKYIRQKETEIIASRARMAEIAIIESLLCFFEKMPEARKAFCDLQGEGGSLKDFAVLPKLIEVMLNMLSPEQLQKAHLQARETIKFLAAENEKEKSKRQKAELERDSFMVSSQFYQHKYEAAGIDKLTTVPQCLRWLEGEKKEREGSKSMTPYSKSMTPYKEDTLRLKIQKYLDEHHCSCYKKGGSAGDYYYVSDLAKAFQAEYGYFDVLDYQGSFSRFAKYMIEITDGKL